MFFNLILGITGAFFIWLSQIFKRSISANWEFYKNDPYSNVDGSWLCFLQLIPRFFLFLGYFCWIVCLSVDLYCLTIYLLNQ